MMRQPELSEQAVDALRLLGEHYTLTRRISESQSLSWPCAPVERLTSQLVPPSGSESVTPRAVHQRVARALIERQLVKPARQWQINDYAMLTEYTISAKGRRALDRA